ncbi:MAG: hypothetical protein ACO1PW_03665 [Actinomycetota bacterium]
MRTRVRWIAVVLVGALAVALVVWLATRSGDDEDGRGEVTTTTSSTSSSTTSTTEGSSTTGSTSTTGATTTNPGPGPVTDIESYPGAGSGEIELAWGTVPGATGYRVLRADTSDGPFTTAVEIDVTTGAVTDVAEDVTNVWSDQYSYRPVNYPFEGPDTSAQIRYVEYSFAPQRCFRVVAIGPDGPGPGSPVACGSPP